MDGMREISDEPQVAVEEITGTFDFEGYGESFDQIVTTGYRDADLEAKLRDVGPALYLFTGGGILPASLLEIPGVRFLHQNNRFRKLLF